MRSASLVSCAAALIVCAACGPSCSRDRRTEDAQAELLGYRALAKDGDARLIPEHDAESLPVIRVPRGAGSFALAFVTTSTSIAAELDAPLVRGEATLLRVHRMRGVARGLGRLELSRDGGVVHAWEVRFTEVPDRLPVFAKVRTLRAEKRFDEAQAELDRLAPDLSARERLQALVESARITDAAGRGDEAIAKWKQLASAALEAGVPTEASRALRNAAYTHQFSRRILESQPLLDEAEAIDRPIHNVAGQSRTAHYRATALEELGDFRAATEARREAARTARALGLDREAAFHEKALGALLQNQGQHAQALVELTSAAQYFEGDAAPPEHRAAYENDLGWVLIQGMAQDAFPQDHARVRELFLRALSLFRARGEPTHQAVVISNLMWLAYLEGDRDEAAKLLDEARKLDPEDRGRAGPFTRILSAELALDARRYDEAVGSFERAAAEGLRESGGQGSEYVWRAQYGVARTLAARGDKEAALAHFRTALEEMNRVAERVALRDTRTLFFDDRRRLVDDTLELLIERGLDTEAFALADESKTHLLRALEASVRADRLGPKERAEWNRRVEIHVALRDELDREGERAALAVGDEARIAGAHLEALRVASARAFDDAYTYLDQIVPLSASPTRAPDRVLHWLADDEALIASMPVGARTLSFVLRGSKVEHAWAPPDYSVAALAGVRHLYIAGDAPTDAELRALMPALSVSFLPWAALLDRAPIEPKGRSLVVADPAGNLPLARREGVAVRAALGDAELLAGEDAGRTRVLSALEHAPLFHFAGHGVLDGAVPWDSRLELARGEALRLEDLLISRPGVAIVVLNGCDTGRTGLLGKRERIGLPEAFLASGARAVLATVRAVGDKEAQSFIARFYAAKGATSPVEAYRIAATAAAAENDDSWLAFRIFGRR